MLLTNFFPSGDCVRSTVLLQCLNCICDVVKKSKVDKLRYPQGSSAMWALLSCLLQPFPKACTTTKFWTRGAHNCVLNWSKTNEAAKDLIQVGATGLSLNYLCLNAAALMCWRIIASCRVQNCVRKWVSICLFSCKGSAELTKNNVLLDLLVVQISLSVVLRRFTFFNICEDGI